MAGSRNLEGLKRNLNEALKKLTIINWEAF